MWLSRSHSDYNVCISGLAWSVGSPKHLHYRKNQTFHHKLQLATYPDTSLPRSSLASAMTERKIPLQPFSGRPRAEGASNFLVPSPALPSVSGMFRRMFIDAAHMTSKR